MMPSYRLLIPYLHTLATLSDLQTAGAEQQSNFNTSDALAVLPTLHPSAAAAASFAANQIRSLVTSDDGAGSWGDRGDIMGLLVRLPFHDGATYNITDGGSDGCVDLMSLENRGLQEAIDLLEPIRLAATYDVGSTNGTTEVLSRGDIWVLAGNVMIEAAGGPVLEYKMGRVDAENCDGQGARHVGAESTSSEDIAKAFVDRLGFTHRQVVALIGAHVLGRAAKENSGYEGKWVKKNDMFTNDYFIDMLHVPWVKQFSEDETFGKQTTWKRFGNGMAFEDEIMLQTDVDLAFQTTGGRWCSRIGGTFSEETSCPNATHPFSSHVRDFALDQEDWFDEFADAWAMLTSMTNEKLSCVVPDCKTPMELPPSSPTQPSSSAWRKSNAYACVYLTIAISAILFGVMIK